MKKQIFGCLALIAAILLSGCGGASGREQSGSGSGSASGSVAVRPQGKKIVIFAGGSSEFSWVEGSEESYVVDYIENRYYEDTGVSLDFEISYLGEDMRTKLTSELAGNSQVDIAVSHTRGGVGIDDFVIRQNLFFDLGDLLDNYGSNVLEYIDGAPLNSMTTYINEIVAIPSVISPYKFGILVRKDYMERCGYTDNAQKATEFCEATGKNYELVDNLDTFEEMCYAMNKLTKNSYAVSGAAWDLEKVLTLGAYTDSGYFTSTKRPYGENGTELVIPGFATDEYKEALAREYKWASTGVISKEANSILLENAESMFISGNTGVFIQDPTINHLIKVARSTAAVDKDAEFTVLGPLAAHKGGTKKGFMRNAQATFAAAILNKSQNVVPIMKFLNWVFKSEENYNLCRYGIEGEHWVNNGDGTYSYPKGKEDYVTRPPYSGILTLVENQRRSDLFYDGYTEQEKEWIALAKNPDNYIENDMIDYILPYHYQYGIEPDNLQQTMYDTLYVSAWTGQSDPLRLDGGECIYDKLVKKYRSSVLQLAEYRTNYYKLMKAKFDNA